MALSPRTITLSTKVLATNGKKEKVSASFIATFNGGLQKILNHTSWQIIGLRKQADGTEVFLDKSVCPLYWRDWSNSPIFGSFDKDYPSEPIVPKEITQYLPNNSVLR